MIAKIDEKSLPISEWIDFIFKIKQESGNGLDLIITDPPYPFDNRNGTGRHNYHNGKDEMYHRMTWDDLSEIYLNCLNLMNEGGRAYIFSNRDGFERTKSIMTEVGWRYLNTIIWDKQRFGGGYHWRNSIEFIHYFCKPKKPNILIKNARNYMSYPKPTKKDIISEINYDPTSNSSSKPNEIWRDILTFGAKDSDVIADPFSGSNPLKAALYLNPNLLKKIDFAYINSFDI